jgi:hypothetical protein
MIGFKFLRSDGTSQFTGYRWPLPDDAPGAWVDAEVDPCRSGIHACRQRDLPLWLGRRLFEVELAGTIVEQEDKVIAGRGRLVREVVAWNDELRDAYTRMCADRAHELARSASASLGEWDRFVEPSTREGPALLGYIARRLAEEHDGPAAYDRERERQAAWLAERLALDRM